VRPDRLLLEDILEAIDEVIVTTPVTRAEFDGNKFVRSHLVRNIQIIGEAAWRLSRELTEQYPKVPWRLIAGMRHAIVHDYFEIDWNEVYNTATGDIPPLRPQIQELLSALASDR